MDSQHKEALQANLNMAIRTAINIARLDDAALPETNPIYLNCAKTYKKHLNAIVDIIAGDL